MFRFPEWVDAHVLAHYRRQPKFDCGNDRPRLGLDPLASGVHVSPKSLDEVIDEQLERTKFIVLPIDEALGEGRR